MSAIPKIPDVHSYASARVFNGTRPLSAARTKKLQARFRQAPAKRRWKVFGFVMAAIVAVAHAVRIV
jgi:hypothetical protein